MIKKIVGFNGSPRKGWNTDMLVQKCLEGAKSVGAETKLYQTIDLKNIKPCISCLSCKRNIPGAEGKCVLKDGLSPILKEIKTVDAIVLGSPVYYGDISALLHPILERMLYSNSTHSAKGYSSYGRKIKTAIILDMNMDEKRALEFQYPVFYERLKNFMSLVFGHCEIMPVYNTLQVSDYSKYDMSFWNIDQKIRERREVFPLKLNEAFELGKRLVS